MFIQCFSNHVCKNPGSSSDQFHCTQVCTQIPNNQQLNYVYGKKRRLRYWNVASQLIQVVRHSTCWIKHAKSQDFSWRFILRRDSHHKTSLKFWKFKHSASKSLCLPEQFPQLFPQVSCSMFSLFRWNSRTWARIHCSHRIKLFEAKCVFTLMIYDWPCWQTTTKPPFARKTATLISHPFSHLAMPHPIAIGVLLFEFSTWRCRYLSWELQRPALLWPCVCWLVVLSHYLDIT